MRPVPARDVGAPPTPEILQLVQDVARAIVALSKPVVAAVHGWVVGAGVEWMLDADIVVAARSARFRLPEIGLGVFVTGGITRTLPAYAGLARAKGLLLLGEEFSAVDAQRWGLIWSVVDDDQLDAETARIAVGLANADPAALGRFKRVLNAMNLSAFEEALSAETRMQTELEVLRGERSSDRRSAVSGSFLQRWPWGRKKGTGPYDWRHAGRP